MSGWLLKNGLWTFGLSLLAALLAQQTCSSRSEIRGLREDLQDARNEVAVRDTDRVEYDPADLDSLLGITRRLVVEVRKGEELRRQARGIAAALDRAEAQLAILSMPLISLTDTLEGQVQSIVSSPLAVDAIVLHESPIASIYTDIALRREGPEHTWEIGERLRIERLRIPLEIGYAFLPNGQLEVFGACDSVPGCRMLNAGPTHIAPAVLQEGLVRAGWAPERKGASLRTVALVGGAGVLAGALLQGALTK